VAETVPRRLEVHAFLQPGLPRARAELLAADLSREPEVRRVTLVPREAAWEEFRKSFRPEDLEGLGDNPLPDKLEIAAADPPAALAIAARLRAAPEVDHVNDSRETLRRLSALAAGMRVGGFALAVVLACGAAAIVGNAIRMTLFARRREIRVMQLVGATDAFIRAPFLIEGALQGALGGLLASGAVLGCVHYLTARVLPDTPFFNEFRLAINLPVFCTALAAAGILLGLAGSSFSLRRFLRSA